MKIEPFSTIEFYNPEKITPVDRLELDRYIHHGEIPNKFLTSALENKLKQTYQNASDEQLVSIPSIVYYLYNNAPAHCWGCPRLVDEWNKQKGMEGIDKVLPSPV